MKNLSFDKNYVVVSYFTLGTAYEERAKNLRDSLERLGIPYDIEGIHNLGSWEKNCANKGSFILEKMKQHPSKNIVWIDADAEVKQDPKIFERIKQHVAVHYKDHKELLSGTVFFRNTQQSRGIVAQWRDLCRQSPKKWDQKVLEQVLSLHRFVLKVKKLPPSYCQIFDTMKHHGDPVIEHYQESRKSRFESNDRVVLEGKSFRIMRGKIILPRKDKKLEDILDRRFDRCQPLQWDYSARKENVDRLQNKYDKGCYIIGKGPSLDNLVFEDFKDDWPILCLNESIHKIESLGLINDIYVMQQDDTITDTCKPQKATMLITRKCESFYKDIVNKLFFSVGQFGLGEKSYSVIVAIRMARFLGCKELVLYGFDAVKNGNCDYAECIGHPSSDGGMPDRFTRHKALIEAENKNDISIR